MLILANPRVKLGNSLLSYDNDAGSQKGILGGGAAKENDRFARRDPEGMASILLAPHHGGERGRCSQK